MRKLTVSSCLILLVFLGSAGESFALPACPSSGVWNNCAGAWTFENGNKYVGEWRNDKFHGQGTYTFADGSKYVGEFRNDKYNGQGTLTLASGTKYVGEFRDNLFHGQGTFTYAGGRVEEGIWENGKLAKKTEPSPDEKELLATYKSYLTLKECHETSPMYISYEELASIRGRMKKIKSHYIDKLGKDVESRTWKKAVVAWKKKFAQAFELVKIAGTYTTEKNQMCRLSYMMLMKVKIPGEKEATIEQDF